MPGRGKSMQTEEYRKQAHFCGFVLLKHCRFAAKKGAKKNTATKWQRKRGQKYIAALPRGKTFRIKRIGIGK
jgi:hypothetical protein